MPSVRVSGVVEYNGRTYTAGEVITGLTKDQADFLVAQKAATVIKQIAIPQPEDRELVSKVQSKGEGKEK